MSLCKCGQESTTTHACDILPTPTVTAPRLFSDCERDHASWALQTIATLQRDLTEARAAEFQGHADWEEMRKLCDEQQVALTEARRQLAQARGALEEVRDFIARYDAPAPDNLYFENWARSDSEYIVDIAIRGLAWSAANPTKPPTGDGE